MTNLVATIAKNTVIRKIPSPTSKKITELNGGNYSLLGRDHQMQWFNVAYSTTDKSVITGWVPRSSIQGFFSGNQPIADSQVPVSDYKYNNRPELRQIMNHRVSQRNTWHIFFSVIAFFVAVGLFSHSSSTRGTDYYGAAIGSFGLSIVLFVAWRKAVKKNFTYPVADELKYLDDIRKRKPMKVNWGEVAAVAGVAVVAAAGVAAVASSASKSSSSKSSKLPTTTTKRLPAPTPTRPTAQKVVNTATRTAAPAKTIAAQKPKPAAKPAPKPAVRYTFDEPEAKPGFGGAPAGSKEEQLRIAAAIKQAQDNGQML